MAGKNNEITTYFKADISDYSENIKSLNRYIQTVRNEFSNATKGQKDWAKSTDGLKAKLTQLNRTLTAQEQILAELEKNYDNLDKSQDENKEEAQKLYSEINKLRANIEKTKNDIGKYNNALDEMSDEAKDSAKELEDLGDVTERLEDGFTIAKGAIATFIGNGLSKLADAAKDAAGNILGLADETREYRQTLATLDSAAEDVGVNTDYMRDKFTDLMGVFKDEDSVTEGLNNLLTAGFDENSLDSITQSLEGAALKWKDTLKFEGMADSLQEWIGTDGASLTGQFAELLERMGYNLDDVTKKTKKMSDEERRKYAADLLAKEGLGAVSEEYRKQNEDMIRAQQANVDYQNSLAEMGEKVEPVTTSLREGFTRILEKVLELVEGVDMEAFATKISDAFTYFIDEIVPKIVDGLQWIKDNKDYIIAGIVGIGAAFLAWKAVSIIMAVKKALEGMTIAQAALNLVMSMNPIGLVVAAIAGLVAAFVVLWKRCEGFRNFWKDLWAKIVNSVKPVIDLLGKKFKDIVEKIKSYFQPLIKFFSGIWDLITGNFKSAGAKIGDAISGAFKATINAAIRMVERAINAIPNAINGAINLLNKLPNVNIGQMSTISLPRLATGGVVDKSTLAQIGEAGREAVIPLERNTRGLDLIADKLAERLNETGETTVNYYNTFTNMPTTRYAIRQAMASSRGMYQLQRAIQGGV